MRLDHCLPLKKELDAVKSVRDIVERKALERAKYEGLDKNERLKTVGDRFYNDLQGLAMFKCSYY